MLNPGDHAINPILIGAQLAERPGSHKQAPSSSSAATSGERWGADRVAEPRTMTPHASVKPTPPASSPPVKPMPAVPTTPDPVDPDGFNREFHAPAKAAEGRGNGR